VRRRTPGRRRSARRSPVPGYEEPRVERIFTCAGVIQRDQATSAAGSRCAGPASSPSSGRPCRRRRCPRPGRTAGRPTRRHEARVRIALDEEHFGTVRRVAQDDDRRGHARDRHRGRCSASSPGPGRSTSTKRTLLSSAAMAGQRYICVCADSSTTPPRATRTAACRRERSSMTSRTTGSASLRARKRDFEPLDLGGCKPAHSGVLDLRQAIACLQACVLGLLGFAPVTYAASDSASACPAAASIDWRVIETSFWASEPSIASGGSARSRRPAGG